MQRTWEQETPGQRTCSDACAGLFLEAEGPIWNEQKLGGSLSLHSLLPVQKEVTATNSTVQFY